MSTGRRTWHWEFNREAIIEDYRRVWRQLAHVPTLREYKPLRDRIVCSSENVITKGFGSWNEFVREAGGKPCVTRGGRRVKHIVIPPDARRCDYGGVVIHYTSAEWGRLQEVKARRADGRSGDASHAEGVP